MRYCFFGLNPGGMTKYPAGIARSLEQLDPAARFTFIIDDPAGLPGVSFPDESKFIERGAPRTSHIREVIEETGPDAVVTTAQRIPDSAFVSAAREAGIATFMFQHGLYLPFMKREPSLFIRKAKKSLDYLRYASAIADIHGESRMRYVRELARVFIRGQPYSDAAVDHSRLNVDLVLLNGDYWRGFHERQYGYGSDRQVVVGYPDFDQLPAIEAQPLSDSVCYVAQTLVEHGRLGQREFHGFLQQLLEAVDGRKLVIKLHPASNIELYGHLVGRPNVTFTRDLLPRCTHYVGHYSTYLALVPFLSRNLFLWEFAGHPIPDSIRPAASNIGQDIQDLGSFVGSAATHEPDPMRIREWQRFFYRGTESAFDAAARAILERLQTEQGE